MPRKPMAQNYNPAAYLKTPRDRALYLQAAIEQSEGDAGIVAAALGDIARVRGMMPLARATGLTREGLYKALSAQGNPGLGTVLKVCSVLGLRLRIEPADSQQPDARS